MPVAGAPTAADIRSRSLVDLGALGFPDDADLQVKVDVAAAFVEWATGRRFADISGDLRPLAEEALMKIVEVEAHQAGEEIVETTADFHLLSSFSAGSYSENRRGLEELKKSGLIYPNFAVHGLLWGVLTDDQRDFWLGLWSGQNLPAFEVTEVDWRGLAGEY